MHIQGMDGFCLDIAALDVLHTLDKGVTPTFLGLSLHVILERKILSQETLVQERREEGIMKIRELLVAYYKGKTCSKIDQLTYTMLGPRKRPELSAQASELRHIVPFVVGLLSQHKDKLGPGGQYLLEAGNALQHYYLIMTSCDRRPTEQEKRSLMDSCLAHNMCYKRAASLFRGKLLPKHHLFYHLTVFSSAVPQDGHRQYILCTGPGHPGTKQQFGLLSAELSCGKAVNRHGLRCRGTLGFTTRSLTRTTTAYWPELQPSHTL